MENCIFCKIIKKEIPAEIIWEDENFLAILDTKPLNDGHALLIPKNHTDYIFDLAESEYAELFLRARELAGPIQEVTKAKRIGIVVEGFGVPHCHIHLVPINKAYELDPDRAKDADPDKLAQIAAKLRHALS